MAKTTRILKAVLDAEDRASPKIAKLGNALKLLGGVAAAVGAYQLGKKLAGGMMHAAELAGIQEAAEVKLAQAIRNTGGSVDELLPKYRAMAARLQDMTGVGDEAILNYQAQLVALGKLSGEGLERATKAALDLAAAQGMDLKAAFDLIAKASAGYTATLSRYGIILDETLPKEQKFEAALRLIEERFGGQAQAKLRTYSGRLEELRGRWNDLLEKIGSIVRTPEIQTALKKLSDGLKSLTESMDDAKIRSYARVVVVSLGQAAKVMLWFGEAAYNTAKLLGAGVTVIKLYGHTLHGTSEQVNEDVRALTESLTAMQRAYNETKRLAGSIDAAISDILNPPAGGGEEAAPKKSIVENIVGDTNAAKEELAGFIEEATVQAQAYDLTLSDIINKWINDGSRATRLWIANLQKIGTHVETLSESIAKSFRAWAVNAAQLFGDTLVAAAFEGKEAFKDFFKNLLRWLAQAIARALVLRAILSFFGAAGQAAGMAMTATGMTQSLLNLGGGVSGGYYSPPSFGGEDIMGRRGLVVGAAGGWLVPGYDTGRDSVRALLRPGEAVLPRELTSLLMETALAGGGGGVEIHLHGSLPALVDELSTGVRNGDYRLVATETATTRVVR